MKIFLTLFVLLFSSSVVANIFECTVEHELYPQKYIMSADENKEVVNLGTINEDGSGVDYADIQTGEIKRLKSSVNNSETYELLVFHNAKEGEGNPFRAIFFKYTDDIWITTIVIETWKENMPFYIFDDYSRKLLKGNCK
jgi:hypothetical protein